jgi:hypothetical protein
MAGALLASVAGCDQIFKQEEEVPEDVPPPPTPDEMVAEALDRLQMLDVIPKDVPLQFLISEQGRGQLLGYIRDWKRETLATEGGEEAVDRLTADLEQQLESARQEQNAAVVLLVADMLEELGSQKGIIRRYREWAEVHNNRPVVVVKGWYEEGEEGAPPSELLTLAIIDVYIPETGEKKHMMVEEGEEFEDLRFIEIIGRKRGVRLRYLPTGDKFDVMQARPYDPNP